MSTRELAHNILEQLKEFIALFGGVYQVSDNDNGQARRDEAFRKLESMRKTFPILTKKRRWRSIERRSLADEGSY